MCKAPSCDSSILPQKLFRFTDNYPNTQGREQVTDIQKRVKDIERKLVYVGATPEERKYINVDGSIKYDVINETCDHILDLFGDEFIDKEGVSKDEINS